MPRKRRVRKRARPQEVKKRRLLRAPVSMRRARRPQQLRRVAGLSAAVCTVMAGASEVSERQAERQAEEDEEERRTWGGRCAVRRRRRKRVRRKSR